MRLYRNGYTLVEMLVTVSLVGILAAISAPIIRFYYVECSMNLAISEIASIIREARALALTSGENKGVCFNTTTREVLLALDRGADGRWNTADDTIARSFRLSDRGGGLHFGYGNCGPIHGLAAAVNGVSFQTNNSLVCNPDLSSNAGTVYLASTADKVMAITVSSNNAGYKIRTCSNGTWSQ
jgi:prepilin-type N-terminal cleavage/methylation domain-containing protein